jgi:hypothetical protein
MWAALGALTLCACGGLPSTAHGTLDGADTMTLVKLDPTPGDAAGERLYGYLVLGKAEVVDAAERAQIVSILDATAGKGTPAKCFNPRHAVLATKGSDRVELVICYECAQIHVHHGLAAHEMITTSPDGTELGRRFAAHGLVGR